MDNDGRLERVRFDGRGCAISTASASLMTETLKGLSVAEARDVARQLHQRLRGKCPIEALDEHGRPRGLQGLASFPVRVKCATLAWHALLVSLPATVAEPR